jgi:hypothetical protein
MHVANLRCVNWGKSPDFSDPQFTQLYNRNNSVGSQVVLGKTTLANLEVNLTRIELHWRQKQTRSKCEATQHPTAAECRAQGQRRGLQGNCKTSGSASSSADPMPPCSVLHSSWGSRLGQEESRGWLFCSDKQNLQNFVGPIRNGLQQRYGVRFSPARLEEHIGSAAKFHCGIFDSFLCPF